MLCCDRSDSVGASTGSTNRTADGWVPTAFVNFEERGSKESDSNVQQIVGSVGRVRVVVLSMLAGTGQSLYLLCAAWLATTGILTIQSLNCVYHVICCCRAIGSSSKVYSDSFHTGWKHQRCIDQKNVVRSVSTLPQLSYVYANNGTASAGAPCVCVSFWLMMIADRGCQVWTQCVVTCSKRRWQWVVRQLWLATIDSVQRNGLHVAIRSRHSASGQGSDDTTVRLQTSFQFDCGRRLEPFEL